MAPLEIVHRTVPCRNVPLTFTLTIKCQAQVSSLYPLLRSYLSLCQASFFSQWACALEWLPVLFHGLPFWHFCFLLGMHSLIPKF